MYFIKHFYQSQILELFHPFDNKKIPYIICAMVVISTAGGNDEQRTRED